MSDNLDHLAVVQDRETGKFQGAYYRNKPTPSGCVRFILQCTTKLLFDTQQEAATEIEKHFPDMPKIQFDKP